VDRFLAELNQRLDFLDSYSHLDLDKGIERAWSTLHLVRDSCARVRDDVMDAGRRRTAILVETLEERYKDVLARKETLEQKVQEGVSLMESFLAECEARAYAVRDSGFGTVVHEFVGRQHKRVGSSVGRAKEAVDEGLDLAWRAAEKMEHAVEKALAIAKEKGLLQYNDLPHPSKRACLYSVLTPSNETFNIWSHLIGLLIVLSIAFYFYPTSTHFSIATKTDVVIAGIFFFAACKCLVCSCMWHTFNSIAEKDLMERFACVDYTGISLLIAASIMTTEYTAFYCEPTSRWLWIGVTALFGIGGTILPWHPTFNKNELAWVRVGFYVLLAATGALPVVQITMTRGMAWTAYFYSPITKSLLVYLCGAILYAAKVPERWFPGAFDYVGGSHNIWHLAVLGGILFHYHAMQQFFAQAFLRRYYSCSAW
jgi:adiponectin receptor